MCNNGLNDFVEVPLINGIISSVNDNTGRGVLFVYMCTYVCNVVTRVVVKSAVNDVWCTYVRRCVKACNMGSVCESSHTVWGSGCRYVCIYVHMYYCFPAASKHTLYIYIRTTLHCVYCYFHAFSGTYTYIHTYVRTHTYTYITYIYTLLPE